jgi:hypothetical protein
MTGPLTSLCPLQSRCDQYRRRRNRIARRRLNARACSRLRNRGRRDLSEGYGVASVDCPRVALISLVPIAGQQVLRMDITPYRTRQYVSLPLIRDVVLIQALGYDGLQKHMFDVAQDTSRPMAIPPCCPYRPQRSTGPRTRKSNIVREF